MKTHIANLDVAPVTVNLGKRGQWDRYLARCGLLIGVDRLADRMPDATCETCSAWYARQVALCRAAIVGASSLGLAGETADGWRP